MGYIVENKLSIESAGCFLQHFFANIATCKDLDDEGREFLRGWEEAPIYECPENAPETSSYAYWEPLIEKHRHTVVDIAATFNLTRDWHKEKNTISSKSGLALSALLGLVAFGVLAVFIIGPWFMPYWGAFKLAIAGIGVSIFSTAPPAWGILLVLPLLAAVIHYSDANNPPDPKNYGSRQRILKELEERNIVFKGLSLEEGNDESLNIALFNYPCNFKGNAEFFIYISQKLSKASGKINFMLIEKQDLEISDYGAAIKSGLVLRDDKLYIAEFTEPIQAHCVIEPFEENLRKDLEDAGVVVIPSSRTIELSGDRLAQHRIFEKYGISLNRIFDFIPYEYDIFCIKDRLEDIVSSLKKEGVQKVCLKSARFSGGSDFVCIEDIANLNVQYICHLLERIKAPLIIERLIEPVGVKVDSEYHVDERYKMTENPAPGLLENLRNAAKVLVVNSKSNRLWVDPETVVRLSHITNGTRKTVAYQCLDNFLKDLRFKGGQLDLTLRNRMKKKIEALALEAMKAVLSEDYETDLLCADILISNESDDDEGGVLPRCYLNKVSTHFFADHEKKLVYGKSLSYWEKCFDYICYMAARNRDNIDSLVFGRIKPKESMALDQIRWLGKEDRSIPFMACNDHQSMYFWVQRLQKHGFAGINRKTQILIFDAHSGAADYGSGRPDHYNWVRAIREDGINTGRHVWVRVTGEPDSGVGFYGRKNIFESINKMAQQVSGPAIIFIDYDFVASVAQRDLSDKQIERKVKELTEAMFFSGITPVAVSLCYSCYKYADYRYTDNGLPVPGMKERISAAFMKNFEKAELILQGDVGVSFDILRSSNLSSVVRGIKEMFNLWGAGKRNLSLFLDDNCSLFWYMRERFKQRVFLNSSYFRNVMEAVFEGKLPSEREFAKAARKLSFSLRKCERFIALFASHIAGREPINKASITRLLRKSGYKARDYLELLRAFVYIVMKYKAGTYKGWSEPAERFTDEASGIIEKLIAAEVVRLMHYIEREYQRSSVSDRCDILESLLHKRYGIELEYLVLFIRLPEILFEIENGKVSHSFILEAASRFRIMKTNANIAIRRSCLLPASMQRNAISDDCIPIFARSRDCVEPIAFGKLEQHENMFHLHPISGLFLNRGLSGFKLAEDFEALVAVFNKSVVFKQSFFNIIGFPTDFAGGYAIGKGEEKAHFPEWACLLLKLISASAQAVTFDSRVYVSPHHDFICKVRQVIFEMDVISRAKKETLEELLLHCEKVYPACLLKDLVSLRDKLNLPKSAWKEDPGIVEEAISFVKSNFPQFRHYQRDLYSEVLSVLSQSGEKEKINPRIFDSLKEVNRIISRAKKLINIFYKRNGYIPRGRELEKLLEGLRKELASCIAISLRDYSEFIAIEYFFNMYLKYLGDLIEVHSHLCDGISDFLKMTLNDFYSLWFALSGENIFWFIERLFNEFGNDQANKDRALVFLGRGSEDIYRAAKSLAMINKLPLPKSMYIIVSRDMIDYYGAKITRDVKGEEVRSGGREEVVMKYLYDHGALDRREIVFVDTGFRGSIPCRLADILNDTNIRNRFSWKYKVRLPIEGDYVFKLRMIRFDRRVALDEFVYSDHLDDITDYSEPPAPDFNRTETAFMVDDGLEKEIFNNVSLAENRNRRVSLIKPFTHRRGLLALTRRIFENAFREYKANRRQRLLKGRNDSGGAIVALLGLTALFFVVSSLFSSSLGLLLFIPFLAVTISSEESIRQSCGKKTPSQIVRQLGWVTQKLLRKDIERASAIAATLGQESVTDEGLQAIKELRAIMERTQGACNALIKTVSIAERMVKDVISKALLSAFLRTVIHKYLNRAQIINGYLYISLRNNERFSEEGLNAIRSSFETIMALINTLPRLDSVRGVGDPKLLGTLIEIYVPGISNIEDFPYLLPDSPVLIKKLDQKKSVELIRSVRPSGSQEMVVIEVSSAEPGVFSIKEEDALKLSRSGHLTGRSDGIFAYSRCEKIRAIINRETESKITKNPLDDQGALLFIQAKAEYVEQAFSVLAWNDPDLLLEKALDMQNSLKEKARINSWDKNPEIRVAYKSLIARIAYFIKEATENRKLISLESGNSDLDADENDSGDDNGDTEEDSDLEENHPIRPINQAMAALSYFYDPKLAFVFWRIAYDSAYANYRHFCANGAKESAALWIAVLFYKTAQSNKGQPYWHINPSLLPQETRRLIEIHESKGSCKEGNRAIAEVRRLSEVLRQMGEHDLARRKLTKEELFKYAAELGVSDDKLVDALPLFHAILRVKPDYAPARFNLASIYYSWGETENALENWALAVRQDPGLLKEFSQGFEDLKKQVEQKVSAQEKPGMERRFYRKNLLDRAENIIIASFFIISLTGLFIFYLHLYLVLNFDFDMWEKLSDFFVSCGEWKAAALAGVLGLGFASESKNAAPVPDVTRPKILFIETYPRKREELKNALEGFLGKGNVFVLNSLDSVESILVKHKEEIKAVITNLRVFVRGRYDPTYHKAYREDNSALEVVRILKKNNLNIPVVIYPTGGKRFFEELRLWFKIKSACRGTSIKTVFLRDPSWTVIVCRLSILFSQQRLSPKAKQDSGTLKKK
jgi:hypothetical protein